MVKATNKQRPLLGQVLILLGVGVIVLGIAIWDWDGTDDGQVDDPGVTSESTDESPDDSALENTLESVGPTIPALDNAASHRNTVQDYAEALDNVADDYAEALDNAANIGREDVE